MVGSAYERRIPIKTRADLAIMRQAGRIVGQTHGELGQLIKPGIRTMEIEEFIDKTICKQNGIPAFKGYRGFPFASCISVNEEVVHGFPSERVLEEGDIVSVDIGVKHKGFYGDSAHTFAVGAISEERARLIKVTRNSLEKAFEILRDGVKLTRISAAIQECVEEEGFSVVRKYVGHGIGRNLHEEPEVRNYVAKGLGGQLDLTLRTGMVLAIEPMVNIGTHKVQTGENKWVVYTQDKKASAHFEHTIAVLEEGMSVLTAIDGADQLWVD